MSNFSKFSLCLVLTVSIVLMRTPIVSKADAILLPLTSSSSSSHYQVSSGESVPISFPFYVDQVDNSPRLIDYTYFPSTYDSLLSYLSYLNQTYSGYTVLSNFSVPYFNFSVDLVNNSSYSVSYSLAFITDNISVSLNYTANEGYPDILSYPAELLEIRAFYTIPAHSTQTVTFTAFSSSYFFGSFDALLNNYYIASTSVFSRNIYVRLNGSLRLTVLCSNESFSDFSSCYIRAYMSSTNNNYLTVPFSGYFLYPVKPQSVSGFRFIDSLRNIWSAINGQSTTGNLDQTIRQQLQQQTDSLENGYNTDIGDGANGILSNAINDLDAAESFSGAYMDHLNDFTGFDFQESEDTLQAMKLLSDGATSVMENVSLVRALVIGGITFFIVAVIIGVRRYI